MVFAMAHCMDGCETITFLESKSQLWQAVPIKIGGSSFFWATLIGFGAKKPQSNTTILGGVP